VEVVVESTNSDEKWGMHKNRQTYLATAEIHEGCLSLRHHNISLVTRTHDSRIWVLITWR